MTASLYTPVVVCDDRLEWTKGVHLKSGAGSGFVPGNPAECHVCIMQLANIVSCELHDGKMVPLIERDDLMEASDDNATVDPVIRRLCISTNDRCPDGLRDELLLPVLKKILNTRGSFDLSLRRAFRVVEWSVREILPDVLEKRNHPEHAATLRALEPITTRETSRAAAEALRGISESLGGLFYSWRAAAAAAADAAAAAADADAAAAAADADAAAAAAAADAADADAAAAAADAADADAADAQGRTLTNSERHRIYTEAYNNARNVAWRKITPLILELCEMPEAA